MTHQERYKAIMTWCLSRAIDRPWSFFAAVDRGIEGHYSRFRAVHYGRTEANEKDAEWLASMERTVEALKAR